jgi:hypothetical protein
MLTRSILGCLGVTAILLSSSGAPRASIGGSQSGTIAARSTATDAATNDPDQCRECHAEEVDGYAQSRMARSMRLGAQEASGIVRVPGTTIRMHSDKQGSWQTLESHRATNTYHVDYVIGSGTHASGYIVKLGDHLFQSPVAYYRSRGAYDLAPGYEGRHDPDFTRPIAQGCVFCHAGSFDAVAGTENEYGKTPFTHLTIGCDRCHGDTAAHLVNPSSRNIVNPARLAPGPRDSVCEQCHLIGAARVLNPGKRFSDFAAGKPLEETFTVYRNVPPPGTTAAFRVISHSEQLALSKCARSSGGQMWCGTCHDPHQEPAQPVAYYREKCLQCHARTSFAVDHPSRTSNCIGCHMPKRAPNDGGHTAFTDHRIQRQPHTAAENDADNAPPDSLAAWRQPPSELATRNLGIASVDVGLEKRSPKLIVDGYQMLTGVQQQFPQDSELFNTMGLALFVAKQYGEAVQAFELAVRFDPQSSPKESSLGQAYLALGEHGLAEQHLERAMELDSLNLGAAAILISAYNQNGEEAKADKLSRKITDLVRNDLKSK